MKEPQVTWDKEYDLNEDRLFERPDNLLYHPVKGQFIERERKLKNEISRLKEDRISTKVRRVATWPIRKIRNLIR